MYYYAQLNKNNICVAVSCLSGQVNSPDMIPIDSFNADFIWRKYENGQWSQEKYEPQTTAPLTDYEQTKQRLDDLELAVATILGGAMG